MGLVCAWSRPAVRGLAGRRCQLPHSTSMPTADSMMVI